MREILLAIKPRSRLISLGLSLCLLGSRAFCETRLASLEEIQTLFDLATERPQRIRVVADVTTYEPKWSEEQVSAAIKSQNDQRPELANLPEADQRERTNAIARSQSGKRILHAQEWYSAGNYRLDHTDEGMFSEQYLKDHLGAYQDSYVIVKDPALSAYKSFTLNHHLRSARLSATVDFAQPDYWRGLGLDGEFVFPLLVALRASQSRPEGVHAADPDLNTAKINPSKAEQLHNGSHPTWRLEVIALGGQENRARFVLRGKTLSMVEPRKMSDMVFVYVVGKAGQRSVCMNASLTNLNAGSSIVSVKEDFDQRGFPRMWRRTTLIPGSPPKQIDVEFKEIELNPKATDQEVFAPRFAADYIVSDVSSGKSVVLQNPLRAPTTSQASVRPTSAKRIVIISVFALIAVGLWVAVIRMKSTKT